jgi:Cdc6-like AAA superfamily ATPase
MEPAQKAKMLFAASRAFSPSAPVDRLTLFAGRLGQIRAISNAIGTRGRHAIMFGNRGVGKTSLANILKDLFTGDDSGVRIVKVNCVESDGFRNVWQKAFSGLSVIVEGTPAPDGAPRPAPTEYSLDQYVPEAGHFGPGEVRKICQYASQENFELVIVFDEFDRLDEQERGHFADTIKDLSDNSVNTTLVLVGVATDVVHLISEHASIDRCLKQIPMPPMAADELLGIIEKAATTIGIKFEGAAASLIVSLSQGLPHYTHLIGQESACYAIQQDRNTVTIDDVSAGIRAAIDTAQESVKNDYHRATSSQRKGTLYPQVLLACAMAKTDEMGTFSSSDVRDPLCQITDEDYEIPNFSQHLDNFSSDPARGPILEKSGASRRFRFRFRNPLLRPYIIMKGLNEGQISGDLIEQIQEAVGSKPPVDK